MPAAIKLRQLRTYRAIISEGSLSAAADKLNLTQPAVSKQLAALEEALDMRLFNRRRGGPLIPTHAAIELYKAIEGTLSGLETIPELAREISEHARTRLRIVATPPVMNSQPLMQALAEFMETHPSVRLALESRHRLDIEEWIVSRQADLGLALLPVSNPELVGTALVTTRAVAVAARSDGFSSGSTVSLDELDARRLILPSRQPLRDLIDGHLRDASRSASAHIESSSAITCCRLAAAGLGIALCDPFSPSAFSARDIAVMKLEPKIALTHGVIMRKDSERSAAMDALLETLRRHLGMLET